MAESIKILAQSLPSNTTLTDIYTVPNATSTTISSITVCNQDTVVRTFRISVAKTGEVTNNKHFIFYDQEIDAKSNFSATIGITLGATDVLRVQASAANVIAFNVFGIEVS